MPKVTEDLGCSLLVRDPHHETLMRLDNHTAGRQSLCFPQVFSGLPKVELAIVRGRVRNRIRPVTGPVFLIGGSTQCDLVLGDPRVPAVHSYLLVTRRGVTLRHLGEPPLVLVEGRPVETAQLADGQQISLPPFQFQVRIVQAGEDNTHECPHHAHAWRARPHHHLHLHRAEDRDAASTDLGLNHVDQRGWN